MSRQPARRWPVRVLAAAVGALAAAPAPAGTLPMCELLKPAEVIALAPFKLPLLKAEGWPMASSPSGCRYRFESADGSESASVAIGVTSLATAAVARTHFDTTASRFRDLWQQEPQQWSAPGDKAWFGGEDETGLKVLQGALVADINMGGQFPEVTAEMKKTASLALAQQLLKRLPQLKLQ